MAFVLFLYGKDPSSITHTTVFARPPGCSCLFDDLAQTTRRNISILEFPNCDSIGFCFDNISSRL
eukprot:4520939-Amphidinium_carterae.1